VLRRVPRDRRRGDAGFSLIELLIALIIISVLAAVATAGYGRKVAASRQTYAQQQLMLIAQAQEMYRYQNGSYATQAERASLNGWQDTYPAAAANLGFTYTFTITNAGTQVLANGAIVPIFTAQAQGNIDSDATLDTWTIDQNSNLQNTVNDVNQ